VNNCDEETPCEAGLMCCSNECETLSCVQPVTLCIGDDGISYEAGESIVAQDECESWYAYV
jgi:hypothetical protein